MRKAVLLLSALILSSGTPIAAMASDGLGKTLNMYYGTYNLSVGGLTFSGNNGGTIPQIRLGGPIRIGNFYLGGSYSAAIGKIDGFNADRYSLTFKPGWIIPINRDIAVVPYVLVAGVGQIDYIGSLRTTNNANLKYGYNIGGGVGLQWSPIDRLIVTPSVDASYYRQGYEQYNNNDQTSSTVYETTSEYRERLGVYYYLTDWLNVGIHIGADQFGKGGTSLISYGAGLGINF